MTEQITPGTWAVEYDGPSNPIITATSTTGNLRWQIVALVKTSEADARVMAAAKELYEEVRSTVECWERGDAETPMLFAKEARALINRIEGKDGK